MTSTESTRFVGTQVQVWPLTVQAYHALGELGMIPERSELLHGQIYQKMSKSPLHRFLCQRLLRQLRRVQPDGTSLWQEQPITCGDSELEPDLSLVAGLEESFRSAHPRTAELVVEVCVTSHEYDRSKLGAYALAGVKECWLVLGPERIIEVFSCPLDGTYTKHSKHAEGRVASVAVQSFVVELEQLFSA